VVAVDGVNKVTSRESTFFGYEFSGFGELPTLIQNSKLTTKKEIRNEISCSSIVLRNVDPVVMQ
jgi:hypothetical protein